MTTLQQATKTEFTEPEMCLLNILRCEPPSHAFNFFEYGGLPRSVFRMLGGLWSEHGSELESILSDSPSITTIPSSTLRPEHDHNLIYDRSGSIDLILANAHNNYSQNSDLKVFAKTKITGVDGRKYEATFVALEVYREKGNMHPVWQLGLYITDPESPAEIKDILYEESIIIDMPQSVERSGLNAELMMFIGNALGKIEYNPELNGINQEPSNLRYLREIIQNIPDINVIDGEVFKKNAGKWFRYLFGTLDFEDVIKFEDLYDGNTPVQNRVALVSTHLTNGTGGEYLVEVSEETEPGEEGPFSHEEAIRIFVEIGNDYLQQLYDNAGKGKRQFEIAVDWTRVEFRYATIVKDLGGEPIVISSWATPFSLDGKKLPQGQYCHYLQLWGSSPEPWRLDEGIDFTTGVHPKTFMKQLQMLISETDYDDHANFLEQAKRYNVPIISR